MTYNVQPYGYDEADRMLQLLVTDASKRYASYLERLGMLIVSDARSNLESQGHIHTGELVASIEILEVIEGKEITVGSALAYAAYIEDGRPEVKPVHAKVLHWVDKDGNDVFAKKSKAVEPSPFLLPAVIARLQGLPALWVEREGKFIESIS